MKVSLKERQKSRRDLEGGCSCGGGGNNYEVRQGLEELGGGVKRLCV